MKNQLLLPTIAMATVIAGAASVLVVASTHPGATQGNPTLTNIVPESEAVTVHAKIKEINHATRAVTLVGASGNSLTVTAGPVVRLELLKVGDNVNAKYYRSVGFVVNPPTGSSGTPVSDNQMTSMLARPTQGPGGVGLRLTKMSGTVVGINLTAHSIDVVDPSGGGVYTVDVTDPARIAMLGSLKVGDTITAVISEVLAVLIDPVPERYF
jgi:hypothetical protein